MPSTVNFSSTTPRFYLPLLFSGQAQKEVFVNEALARLDAMLHCAVEGSLAAPPLSPEEGTNWLVLSPASGNWAGHENSIACYQEGNWIFIPPCDGMQLLDRSTGQFVRYRLDWHRPVAPTAPTDGSIVDSGARSAIAALISALKDAGIFCPD